jgi:hypothetical protein
MAIEGKRTQGDYSLACKLGVVASVEKGEMTSRQAQKKFGIHGRSTALVWLRRYGQQDWSPLVLQLVRSARIRRFNTKRPMQCIGRR